MKANVLEIAKDLPDEMFMAVEFNATSADRVAASDYSYWGSTVRTFLRSHLVKAMIVVVLALVLFTLSFPLFDKTDPNSVSIRIQDWNQRPSAEHFFGTDYVGRDIWARVWHGARMSFALAGAVVIFETTLGVILGSIWGFNRSTDAFFFALYNTLTNIPSTIYVVLIAYVIRPSFWTVIIALAGRGWIGQARWYRNRILSLREADYNTVSRCLSTPTSRIISRNIVPHIISLIIMNAALTIPSTIGSEVFLAFIGIGLPQEMITLGNLVNQGRSKFLVYPYQMVIPALILSVITISFYILGNRFADASDPRNHV